MMNKRPVIQVPTTTLEKWHNAAAVLLILAALGYVCFVWPQVPEIVPSHVDGAGHVNGWSHKRELFYMPLLSLVLFTGLTVLSKFPHKFNYWQEITEENAPRQYRVARLGLSWIKVLVVALFAVVEWQIIQLALS